MLVHSNLHLEQIFLGFVWFYWHFLNEFAILFVLMNLQSSLFRGNLDHPPPPPGPGTPELTGTGKFMFASSVLVNLVGENEQTILGNFRRSEPGFFLNPGGGCRRPPTYYESGSLPFARGGGVGL